MDGKYLYGWCGKEFDSISEKRVHERWCSYSEEEDDGAGDSDEMPPVQAD